MGSNDKGRKGSIPEGKPLDGENIQIYHLCRSLGNSNGDSRGLVKLNDII